MARRPPGRRRPFGSRRRRFGSRRPRGAPPATAVEAEADDDDEGFVAPWSTDELQGFAPDAAPAAAEVDDVD